MEKCKVLSNKRIVLTFATCAVYICMVFAVITALMLASSGSRASTGDPWPVPSVQMGLGDPWPGPVLQPGSGVPQFPQGFQVSAGDLPPQG